MPRKEDKWNKQGEHNVSSHEIEAYKLPVTNQDTERKTGFGSYTESTPGQALMDAISGEGTTGKGNQGNYHDFKELKRRYK